MTQGDLFYPTILNVVVDVVVMQWVTVMVEGVGERGDHGQEGRHQNSLFYADDGMVALLGAQCLQIEFSTLFGLFNRMGPVLPPMPGGGDPVGGGVRAMDDGRGTLIPVAAEGTGAVQVVRGGDGGGIVGEAQYDIA